MHTRVARAVPGAWVDGGGLGPWLGAFQPPGSTEPGGGWTWLTGEPFAYAPWESNEPSNDAPGESYLHYFDRSGGRAETWNDYYDDEKLPGFIVELE